MLCVVTSDLKRFKLKIAVYFKQLEPKYSNLLVSETSSHLFANLVFYFFLPYKNVF